MVTSLVHAQAWCSVLPG